MNTIFRMATAMTVFLLAVAIAAPVSSQPTITITDLGGLPGAWRSTAADINELGQVVGWSEIESRPSRAFLWTAQGGMQDLDIEGMATGINDAGQIVGLASGQAFFLDITHTLYIPPPLGEAFSQAWEINNQGQVVGCYGHPSGDWFEVWTGVFIWTEATGMQDISAETGLSDACAYDINEHGQIVGESDHGPFIYTPGVGVQYITGNANYRAYGINDAGQVVGKAPDRAFLWSAATGMTYLGSPEENSDALGINDYGHVSGSFLSPPLSGGRHGYFWSEETGMLDLGVLSGYSVSYAGRLNNSGQIVGTSGHAVMWTVALTPPTPQEQIEKIAAKVDVLVSAGTLNAGEGNALDSKLDAATAQLNRGNTNAVRNVLGAFNNQVEALIRTERLSPSQGQPLIDAANAVINQLR